MNNSGSSTHKPRAAAPAAFRAQATGIGQTCSASLLTGTMRAQCVADATPPAQRRATPAAEGRPAPMPGAMCDTGFADSGY